MKNEALIESFKRWAGAYGHSPIERAAVFNRQGECILQREGTLDSVCLGRVRKAHYILHTHPHMKGCKISHGPSIGDLMVFFHLNPLGAIIVVKGVAHYWPRPVTGWPLPEKLDTVYVRELGKAHAALPQEAYTQYSANQIMVQLANEYFPAIYKAFNLESVEL